jgi:hypothetical protein
MTRDRHRLVERGGQAQTTRQIVAGAERDDAHDGVGPPARADPTQHLARGAVAAHRHDVAPFGDRLGRPPSGVAGPARQPNVRRPEPARRGVAHVTRARAPAASARVRVDHDERRGGTTRDRARVRHARSAINASIASGTA